ncbi:hypothetical protein BGZ72_007935 [Mortierella alpina]|nr:hypothetical protein BGZ72_007935 [Mortierella alpina]
MTSESAAHTVFTTPELAFAIAAYLTQHDLTQCVRVCKDWLLQNEPILYTTFFPRVPSANARCLLPTGGLIRNLPHIRTVELCTLYCQVDRDQTVIQNIAHGLPQCAQSGKSAVDLSTLCTNIRRIKISGHHQYLLHPVIPHLSPLLYHNHRLTHLTIPIANAEFDTSILDAISKLQHLQSLAVFAADISTRRRTISLFLKACLPLPKLSELDIDLSINWDDEDNDEDIPDLQTIIEEASIARFSGNSTSCKIKSLRLPRQTESGRFPLARSLLESDLLDLQSFTVPSLPDDSDASAFEQIVRKHCTSLKHLACPKLADTYPYRFVQAVLRGCSGLKSFTSEALYDEGDNHEPLYIISNLIRYHCDTLEDITLEHCHRVFSDDLHAILTRCKQLKRLWVEGAYPNGRTGIEFTDPSMSSWACAELRVLGLSINRYPNDEDSDLDDEDPGLMALDGERFFRQIGQLEKLEELALDIDRSDETMSEESDCAWDLTLSKGWLGELANLKNLQKLRLNADFWSKMGQAEVEFMHEHWPLLNEISLQGLQREVSQQHTLAHWQWLFDKRPRLLFITKER